MPASRVASPKAANFQQSVGIDGHSSIVPESAGWKSISAGTAGARARLRFLVNIPFIQELGVEFISGGIGKAEVAR